MIAPDLHLSSWTGWRFHPAAGWPKHGPTIDKPQTKLWWAIGSWWALLVRPEGASSPDLTIFERVDGPETWRDSGTVISSDPLASADACFDGESLWVATRAPDVGIALHRFHLDASARSWTPDPSGPWRAPGTESPSVSVARGPDGSVWLTYSNSALPWYATGPIDRFPDLDGPFPVPGAAATLWNVDLGALVAMEDEMGLFWSDQGAEAFYFALVSPDGTWRTETAAKGDLVSDDHVALRLLDGRLYVAVKTSKDTNPDRSPDDPLILLLVRERDGAWHRHPVASVSEPVTRPIPLLDPERGRIHVLYTFGPNPGERSIRLKSALLGELEFEDGPGDPVIAAPGAEINDVTSSREPLSTERGAVLLASDGANGRYYATMLSLNGG